MREFDILNRYPKPKAPRKVGKDIRTIENRLIASERGREFFDGDRCNGYGGYNYDGRWLKIAEDIIKEYELNDSKNVLQIGCEKGFLLNDLLIKNPKLNVRGLESSMYAIENSMEKVRSQIKYGHYTDLPFEDNFFDFVISIGPIYTLNLFDVVKALREIERVGKGKSFITLGAYETEEEFWLFNDWTLLGSTILTKKEWIEVLKYADYSGDYKFNTSQALNIVR